MDSKGVRYYTIPVKWLCELFKVQSLNLNTTLMILILLMEYANAHIRPMTGLPSPKELEASMLRNNDGANPQSSEGKGLGMWRIPRESPQYLASNVVTRMEDSPQIYEATARRFFQALRLGANQRPRESETEAASRRFSENDDQVLQAVGEALIGKLRFAVEQNSPGCIDHFTKRVYDDQKVNVCMPQIWWTVAVDYLVPLGLPEHELEAFYNVLTHVDPCKEHTLGFIKRKLKHFKKPKKPEKKKNNTAIKKK